MDLWVSTDLAGNDQYKCNHVLLFQEKKVALKLDIQQGLSTVIEIAFRTTVIYLTIFIGLRLLGKREVGQMTVLDLVLLLLLSNAVQTAMVGSDI